MEEALFVQQIAACLEEVTRGRLSDQVLPRVAEPDLAVAASDEALRCIACDTSGLTLLERLADARLSETHAERLDGLGVIATLVGQYIVFGSKHAAAARGALKHLTEEQKQAVFATTDTLAVVNEDADPLQRAVIRAITDPPSDDAAQEVAHVYLNRMHTRDLLKNLDNALTFCEEVEYLAMDMQPVEAPHATPPAAAVADDCPTGDPVELGISAQIPAPLVEKPTAEPVSFSDDIRKLMLPASFGALTISASSAAVISQPLTPPKTTVTPEPSSPEDDTRLAPVHALSVRTAQPPPPPPAVPTPVPPPVLLPSVPEVDVHAPLHSQRTVEPRGRDRPRKTPKPTTQKSDRGTSMSPERVNQPQSVFYTMAAHPFEDGAHCSPEQSSESVPDVVDEVLTRVDADFASPRTAPSSRWSPSSEVASTAKDASFAHISATSPSASGDELFSQMYSAFMSSRRKAAAASSMAATAAATAPAPPSGSHSGVGARSSALRAGIDDI
jgi:hypothetical protein